MKDLFGGFDARGRRIFLSDEDRATHMHVIGSSGTGKSKLLEWMIRGDIKRGAGLCLIDPHGALYEDLVNWCAYLQIGSDRHWRELILLNPSKGDPVVGFNPFMPDDGELSVQVDRRIAATVKAWDQVNTDHTPTLERNLRLIYTILIEQKLSLPETRHLINFQAKEIRAHLVEQLKDSIIQEEWRELQGLRSSRDWRDEVLSTKNRLFRFLTSKTIARFIGIPDRTLNLQEIMDQGKILLVNLKTSKNLSTENARLFGTLLLSELFEAAKRRERGPGGSSPRPFCVYIDEFQEFLTPDIGDILDQGRKMGIHLILGHQHLGQLRELDRAVYDSVLTNCRIKVVFGGSNREDALTMVDEMFVNQLDLKEIKKAIYITTHINKYVRETVRSKTTGHVSSRMSGSASMGASSSGWGGTTGISWGPGFEGWFDASHSETTSSFGGSSSGSSDFSADAESDIGSETLADVPFILPIPTEELSSVQYWTLDEQRWRMADALKSQLKRHAWITLPGQKTQPMTVPFVKPRLPPPEHVLEYEQELAQKHQGITAAEADRLIEEHEAHLLAGISASIDIELPTKEKLKARIKTHTKSKAEEKKSPLDSLVDDPIGKE